jgi:putative peptidoglycan lipid II flippase
MNLKYSLNKVWRSDTQRVMSLTVIGMMLAFIMDIMIAAKLGTSQTGDSLILALSLPLMLDTVTREGTKSSLVPLFMERKINLNREQFQYFVSGLFNLGFLIGIVITVIIEVFAPIVVPILAPKLPPAGQLQTILLLQICAPLIIFVPNITMLSVLLNSQKKFSAAALRNAIAPGIVVLSLILFWQLQDVSYLIAGTHVLGFGIFLVILLVQSYRHGFKYNWFALPSKKDLQQLGSFSSLPTLGFTLTQGLRLGERLLASLVAVGGVSAYYFALRIFSAIQTIIGVSIATTSLPAMTEQNLAGNQDLFSKIVRKNLLSTLGLTIPIMLVIVFFHQPIIAILYGRGAFDTASVNLTSKILFWLGLGLVFNCIIPPLQSVLYAQQRYISVFGNMVLILIVNISLAWILSQILGLIGISIALSISVAVAALNLIYMLHRLGIRIVL